MGQRNFGPRFKGKLVRKEKVKHWDSHPKALIYSLNPHFPYAVIRCLHFGIPSLRIQEVEAGGKGPNSTQTHARLQSFPLSVKVAQH